MSCQILQKSWMLSCLSLGKRGGMVDVANFAMFIYNRVGQKSIPVFTCTLNEHAFINEMREKGNYRESMGGGVINFNRSLLHQDDFKVNLKGLVNESTN